MRIHNAEMANMFEQLADLMEIEGANPFRIRAYREAARVIRGQSHAMADLVEQGEDLSELPNIGEGIAKKIHAIVETGKLPQLEDIKDRTPAALSDLMHIEGLGPKRVKTLYKELNIRSIEDLKRAARKNEISQLPGFGEKTQQTIEQRLKHWSGADKRTKRFEAEEIAESCVAYLKKSKGIKEIIVAGSYRRCKETVGDLDILVTAKRDSTVMDRFVNYDEVSEVISHGETRSTVKLRSGMQVDLRVVPQVSYGAALHYFTGSKSHNIEVRKLAVKKHLKINEYGVFKGEERIAGKTEEEVYKQVGLIYIPPELREGRGEVEAAKKKRLPELVTVDAIRGDLHCHTKATDGHHTLEAMAKAAADRGYGYLAISEHSQHVTVAHGLNEKRLRAQMEEIDKLNDKLDNIVLLKAIEVDIMEDGSLDLPDSVLKELDLTVCSIHYKFNMTRKKQTDRVIKAMDNPYFSIFAHPSGRLINERDPYDIDLEKVMEAAKERGCYLEVNGQPDRLDLTDETCKMAKDMGLKVAISTDAHSTSDLDFMRFGVDQARRGWLEAPDVINTRSLTQLRKLLKRD